MCFAKSAPSIPKEEQVIQHEANASINLSFWDWPGQDSGDKVQGERSP